MTYMHMYTVHSNSIEAVMQISSHICKAGVDVVFSLSLYYNPPYVRYMFKNKQRVKESTDFVITFCLTWQEVRAPVYIWGAEGGGSNDLSRFRSHQTEDLLVHADKCLGTKFM